MILPVRVGPGGAVLDTIDVESDRANPFSERERELLGECAGALAGLWTVDAEPAFAPAVDDEHFSVALDPVTDQIRLDAAP